MADKLLRIVITGDAKGALGAFAETEAAADGLGGKFAGLGTAAVAGTAVAAASVVAVGTVLYDIGSKFDEAYDKIRVGTGATGDALNALKDDFRTVVGDVPTDFGKASDAIKTLVSKMGIDSGPVLDNLTEQFLELSRITGTDLQGNLQAGASALINWNVPVGDYAAKMDEIFRASQLTGVSFADFTSQLAEAGPVLRASGIDMDASTAIIGALGKAGMSVSDIMPSMSKNLALAAKEGKPAGEAFAEAFAAIKNAPDDTAAAGIALQDFGAKAGPKLSEMIRAGTLDYQGLMTAIGSGTDTIIGAGKDTQDFSEKWELFKNRVLLALEPIAMRVFDGMGKLMDKLPGIAQWVTDKFNAMKPTLESIAHVISAVVTPVIQFFKDHWDELKVVLMVVAGVIGVLVVAAAGMVALIVGSVIVAIVGLTAAAIVVVDALQWFWDKTESVRDVLGKVASFMSGVLYEAFATIRDAVSEVTGWLQTLWDKSEGLRGFFADAFSTGIGLLQTAFDQLRGAVDWLWSSIQRVIDAAKTAIDWVGKIPRLPSLGGGGGVAGAIQDKINQQQSGGSAPGTSTFGGPKAMGGDVYAGMSYLVGENGPEILNMGSRSGSITPNGALGDVIHVHFHGPVARDSESWIVSVIEKAGRSGKKLGPGGRKLVTT